MRTTALEGQHDNVVHSEPAARLGSRRGQSTGASLHIACSPSGHARAGGHQPVREGSCSPLGQGRALGCSATSPPKPAQSCGFESPALATSPRRARYGVVGDFRTERDRGSDDALQRAALAEVLGLESKTSTSERMGTRHWKSDKERRVLSIRHCSSSSPTLAERPETNARRCSGIEGRTGSATPPGCAHLPLHASVLAWRRASDALRHSLARLGSGTDLL